MADEDQTLMDRFGGFLPAASGPTIGVARGACGQRGFGDRARSMGECAGHEAVVQSVESSRYQHCDCDARK
jgi:hypothetical protein